MILEIRRIARGILCLRVTVFVDCCVCGLLRLPSGNYSFAQLSKLRCKDDNGICLPNICISR